MKVSDHPAARRRPAPFSTAEEPQESPELVYQPPVDQIVDNIRDSGFSDETAVNQTESEAETPILERFAEIEAVESPVPTRDPIETAPKDGFDVQIFYGEWDQTGRIARWRHARHFNMRRWVEGGSWVPTDSMAPLPAEGPTHWMNYHNPKPEPEDAAA